MTRGRRSKALSASDTVSERSTVIQAYVWLAVPTVIWLATWVRLWIGLPLALGVAVAVSLIIRRARSNKLHSPEFRDFRIDRKYKIIMALAVVYVISTGVGAVWYQFGGDHMFRNGIFFELVRNPWPVNHPEPDGTPSVLSYYTGFWLLPALVSKLCFGYIIPGNIAQFLYALWGMYIILNFIFAHFGGASWKVFLMFLFFDAWDIVITAIVPGYESLSDVLWLQKDISTDYYHSNVVFTYFGYTYNQAYAALIGLLLIWHRHRDVRQLLLTYSLMFISAPFVAVGIFPVVAWLLIRRFPVSLTWQNVLAILVLLVEACYFASNNRAMKPGGETYPVEMPFVVMSLIFVVFAYGVYMPWLWKRVRRDALFWVLFVIMLFGPLLSLGRTFDMGWRVGVPFAYYFMLKMMEYVTDVHKWRRPRNVLLSVFLAVGALAPATFYTCVIIPPFVHLAGHDDSLANWLRIDPANYKFEWQRIWLQQRLHDKKSNWMYNNFWAEGRTPYTEFLMPRRGSE